MNTNADGSASAQPAKRFRVALSFPGTKREFVRAVAEGLAEKLGREKVFYDNWYKAELAKGDLDLVLGKIYHEQSELIAPFLCQDYGTRPWCGLEWRQMRALLVSGDGDRVMRFRFDGHPMPGDLPIDGYVQIAEDTPENRANRDCTVTPEDVVLLILQRLGHSVEVRTTEPPCPFIDPLHTISPPPENFTGREEDLAALRGLDPAGGAVLTGLKGMGGIGKTALALVLAKEWKGRFPDAQILLDGMGLSDTAPTAGKLMEQVIHAFHPGAKLPEGAHDLKPIYTQVLTGKRVLLLLDNAKDVRQASPLIPPAGCGLIVTSRQGFPLGMQRPYKVGSLPDGEAYELLRKYVPELTDAQAEELWSLCGGLPFALNLAGAVLLAEASDTSEPPDVARYVAKLKTNRLEAFDKAAKETAVDEDAITVTETLRLSEAPLTPEQRNAWRALSVFPAPFDERAALAVAGADVEILRVLLHRSLVDKEKGRLKLHDLAGEYAQREMEAEVLEETWRRYVAHYTAVVSVARDAYEAGGEKVLIGLRLFDAESAHVEAAFAWLKNRTDRPSARGVVLLVDAVVHFAALRWHPHQRIQWLEEQLRCARETGDREAENVALGNLGNAHNTFGDARKAIEYYEESLAVKRETGDRRGEGITINNLGNAHAALGDAGKAIEYYEQGLTIFREIGDLQGEGSALGHLGLAYKNIGDAGRAIEYYRQVLPIFRAIGDRHGAARTLGNLGVAYKNLGDARMAIEYGQQSLVIFRETGDRRGEGSALGNLANAYYDLADVGMAIECHEQQLVISQETGDRRGEGRVLWNSAILLGQQGDSEKALTRAEEAVRILEEIEDPNAAAIREVLEKWKSAGGDTERPNADEVLAGMALRACIEGRSQRFAAQTPVDCSVFAPERVQRSDRGILQVFLHAPEDRGEARAQAQLFDAETAERGHRSLLLNAPHGTLFTFTVEIEEFEFKKPHGSLLWTGQPQAATFPFEVPASARWGKHTGTVVVSKDGSPVGEISFLIEVSRESGPGEPAPAETEARRFRTCFCSYAKEDRKAMLERAQGLEVEYETFIDVLNLRPGDVWEPKIFDAIDGCDVFVIIWSQHARESEWVKRESCYALKRRNQYQRPRIHPIPVEGPPIPPVPGELEAVHFNDRLLHLIRAEALEAEARKVKNAGVPNNG